MTEKKTMTDEIEMANVKINSDDLKAPKLTKYGGEIIVTQSRVESIDMSFVVQYGENKTEGE
jgi:hypothetical protein